MLNPLWKPSGLARLEPLGQGFFSGSKSGDRSVGGDGPRGLPHGARRTPTRPKTLGRGAAGGTRAPTGAVANALPSASTRTAAAPDLQLRVVARVRIL